LKSGLFFLTIILSSSSFADWTVKKPTSAKLTAFDSKCAKFKDSNGKSFEISKTSLQNYKLVAGETQIKYFPESVSSNKCVRATE